MSDDWTRKDEHFYGDVMRKLKHAVWRAEKGDESAEQMISGLRQELAEMRKRRVWP